MQADGRGGGNVEGFLATGLRDAHSQGSSGHEFLSHPLPFVPEQPDTWRWQGLTGHQLVQLRPLV